MYARDLDIAQQIFVAITTTAFMREEKNENLLTNRENFFME